MKNKGKLISFAMALGLMISGMPQTAFAYEVPDFVRVGLESVCKNKTSATLGGDTIEIGTNKNGTFQKDASVSSESGFSVALTTSDYIAIDEEMDQSDASDLASNMDKLGFDAYVAYLGDDIWSVYILGSSVSAVESASQQSANQVRNFVGVRLDGSKESILIQKELNIVFMGTQADDTFTLNGKKYRGMLAFAINYGVMTAVNIVDMQDYLYGVVPSEMPQSYEMEALKAQTIAARTYAITKISSHTSIGYELCDSTHCQVYKGYSAEAARTSQAVDETDGEVACYNGKLIEAVFSASTGGYTENSENVWSATVPYLRAVPVIAEDKDNSWTVTLTLDDLDALLSAKGENIGSAEDIVITKLSTGGRVQEMKIVGTRGEKTLTKENIRTYFSATSSGSLPGKMFNINGKGGDIGVYGGEVSKNEDDTPVVTYEGTLATSASKNGIVANTEGTLASMNGRVIAPFEQTKDNNTATTTSSTQSKEYEIYAVNISTVDGNGRFVFEGIGKGHGVGLSQNGAQAMARLGYTYEEILKYFYTGITIED